VASHGATELIEDLAAANVAARTLAASYVSAVNVWIRF